MQPQFSPSRDAALTRLRDFVPHAGADYARLRNFDLPGHPHVSGLSPYLRHRLITEPEVLGAVLGRHSPAAAQKFIQEVFWRSYWKGWLELRPSVWTAYRAGVRHALDRVATQTGLRRDWEAACRGETGIDAFDHWAGELVQTGYLHNHARMWMASIWCFTLRLPWELGADFFLRHLLDGDPASNTLGWRWVAGLQTPGKTYLATPDNIARYTEGRFRPRGLVPFASPLQGASNPPPGKAPVPVRPDPALRTGLLVTEEDLSPGYIASARLPLAGAATLLCDPARSPLVSSPAVSAFTAGAAADMAARHAARLGPFAGPFRGPDALADTLAWAEGFEQIVTPYAPAGPAAEALDDLEAGLRSRNIPLLRMLRPFDARAWPHATHGFFRFRDKIPALISAMQTDTSA